MSGTLRLCAAAALLGLAACGNTVEEQALIGGGAGGAAAVATDGDLATGVIIGATANVLYCQQNPGACKR